MARFFLVLEFVSAPDVGMIYFHWQNKLSKYVYRICLLFHDSWIKCMTLDGSEYKALFFAFFTDNLLAFYFVN